MKRREAVPTLDLEELLARGRKVRPLPELVRARALSRARKVARTPVLVDAPRARPARFAARAAMAAAIVLGVAGVAFALRQSSPPASQSTGAALIVPSVPLSSASAAASAAKPELSALPLAPSESALAPTASAPRLVARARNSAASIDSESELMRRAHAAYAERNFGTALRLVAEHAKKFPRGVLSEEREALRVRSLAAAGQTADARRASIAFAQRFPRSVLLARIQAFAGPNPAPSH